MKTMQNVSRQSEFHAGKTCGGQFFSFSTYIQRKKLTFSETALSFAVEMKLPTFVFVFLTKLWGELRTRYAFDRC